MVLHKYSPQVLETSSYLSLSSLFVCVLLFLRCSERTNYNDFVVSIQCIICMSYNVYRFFTASFFSAFIVFLCFDLCCCVLIHTYIHTYISTLTRLILFAKSYDDVTYYSKIFLNLTDQQKTCIFLLDEVYVKSMLQYHGSEVFGQAINNPSKLAKRILSYMVICILHVWWAKIFM